MPLTASSVDRRVGTVKIIRMVSHGNSFDVILAESLAAFVAPNDIRVGNICKSDC